MMRVLRYVQFPARLPAYCLLLLSAVFLLSCEDDTVGPGAGTGTLLRATVDGGQLTFSLTPGFSSYDPDDMRSQVGGTTAGSPARTLTIFFSHDIDTGSFPVTLSASDVNINYLEGSDVYECVVGTDNCSITLTASDGEVVDGTFSATLSLSSDNTQKVEITDGAFSAALSR